MDSSVNPKGAMPYMRFLDGLRFVAITWVFLFHLQYLFRLSDHGLLGFVEARGWMGVDLFFVISGFLITTILLREHAATGRISLRKFYMRRALRIWPVYYLMIVLTILGALIAFEAGVHSKGIELIFSTIKWPAMYLTDMYTAYANTQQCALLHSWSLAIEEQFYLLWPLFLCWNVKWAKRVGIGGIVAIAAWRTWLTLHMPAGVEIVRRTFYAPDTRMDQLLYGAVLAFILLNAHQTRIFTRLVKRWDVQAATLAIFLISLYINTRWSGHLGNAVGYSMDAFSMTVGIGYLTTAHPRWILTVLEWGPLVYIGRISYAMYLFSPFVIMSVLEVFSRPRSDAAALGLGIAAYGGSLLVAALSYRYFESPFLRLKARLSAIPQPRGEAAPEPT